MDINNRWWEQWDKEGIAQTIDNIWTKNDVMSLESLHRKNLARLFKTYYKSEMKKILEVGCGTGLIYQTLINTLADSQYIGIDVSHEMLKIAKAKFPESRFEWGDAFDLNFKDKSFDLVFSFEVLIHLPEMETPLAEMIRVANKMVIFTVWMAEEEKITTVEINGVSFIHHYYVHNKILNTIHQQAQNRPHHIDVRPISDYTWAYIIFLGQSGEDRVLSFPGFGIDFISSTRELYKENRTEIENLKEKLSLSNIQYMEVQNNLSKEKRISQDLRNHLKTEQGQHFNTQNQLREIKEGFKNEQKNHSEAQTIINSLEQSLHIAVGELTNREKILHTIRREKLNVINTPKSFRQKILNFVRAFQNRHSLENEISPAFIQLRDDSFLFSSSLNGYYLQPSGFLNNIVFLPYSVQFNRPLLNEVLIAPILEISAAAGQIGIEIISPKTEIVRHLELPLNTLNLTIPTRFSFVAIPETNLGIWELRIFITDADVPVQLFEWRKPSIFRREFIIRKPFFGFSFAK